MPTMRFVAVADTLDARIGATVQVDLDTLPALFREGAEASGLRFDQRRVQGDSFAAENIRRVVEDLPIEPDDIVVFYYSGHGARAESKTDAWPVMALGGNGFGEIASFDLAWVYATLKARRPRALVIAVDCCQEEVDDTVLEEQSMRGKHRGTTDTAAARALFASFRGEALVMSCRPGELSGCNPGKGGFFTFELRQAIEDTLYGDADADWRSVLRACEEISEDQNPIWRVEGPTHGQPGLEPFPGQWNCVAGTRAVTRRARPGGRRGAGNAFCTACGAALTSVARFCAQCGAPVGAAPSVPAAPPVAPPVRTVQDTLAANQARVDDLLARHQARLEAVQQKLAGTTGSDGGGSLTRGDVAACPTCGNDTQTADLFRCSRCNGLFCTCSTVRRCQGRCRCGNGSLRTFVGRVRPRR